MLAIMASVVKTSRLARSVLQGWLFQQGKQRCLKGIEVEWLTQALHPLGQHAVTTKVVGRQSGDQHDRQVWAQSTQTMCYLHAGYTRQIDVQYDARKHERHWVHDINGYE